MSKLIIASQFSITFESLHNYLVKCVQEEWIDNNPTVLLPINRMRDTTAFAVNQVIKSFELEVIEYHALWQDYSEPCQFKYNGFGKYNSLAGHNRNMLMAEDATHAIIIWDGEDKDLRELIRALKAKGIPLRVETPNV